MIILEKPNFPPYVCISCGLSIGRRWFVSLDLPLDNYFNPVNEGNVFYCNECWEELATKVAKAAQTYLIGQEPWQQGEYVKPEYEDTSELVEEVNFGPRPTNIGTTIHNPTTERSDTTPEPDDSEPESTDDVAEPESVSEFRVFFGDDTGGDNGKV